MDEYKKSLTSDIKNSREYYLKSVIKTEQQKMFENLLSNDSKFKDNLEIADIACGGDIELSLS